PGTLLRCATCEPSIDLEELDAVILSHAHVDHSTDVNAIIDAMTRGGFNKRGSLFAPDECLHGKNRVVLNYLRDHLDRIIPLKEETTYHVGNLTFNTSVRHDHCVETYGIQFHMPPGNVSFLVDTGYFPELVNSYQQSHVLVLNVVRNQPHDKYDLKHLNIREAEEIIRKIQPRLAIITHFGMTMIKNQPWELAKEMSERLNCRVVAASDGKTVNLEDFLSP
ncbi:MAG: MBL fold metallo-hydrolase, partial [Planctomycetota bacterium]